MEASRRVRSMVVQEDAGDDCTVSAAMPYEDALDFAVRLSDLRPRWICSECGTHHPGDWVACRYCGTVRDDVDL